MHGAGAHFWCRPVPGGLQLQNPAIQLDPKSHALYADGCAEKNKAAAWMPPPAAVTLSMPEVGFELQGLFCKQAHL